MLVKRYNALEIEAIPPEAQAAILARKLDERAEIASLTHLSNKQHLLNRAICLDLCAGEDGWKYFVNNFVWIQDPESQDFDKKEIPFLLWDFQEKAGDEIVKAVTYGYDLPIEKTRKMGLTWLVLAILLWGWNFKQWDVLIGSRKGEEVDKRGDMGSLFEKMRYMIRRLPDWMITQLSDKINDRNMVLIHPKHGASIVGEANNEDFGRSDRRKVAFLDEFTSWEFTDRSAWQGLSATTKCRIPVSTPNRRGTNCYFHKIIEDCEQNKKNYLSLPWTLHPEFAQGMYYDELGAPRSPWYDSEVSRAADEESVAQEIDINYEASMGGKVFPTFNYDLQVVEGLEYDEDLPLYVTWDFGLDMTAMLWIQPTKDGLFNIIDEYQHKSIDIYHYIDILDSKEYKQAIHFGDPNSGEHRQFTSGQSPANILRRYGIIFRSEKTRIATRVAAARNIVDNFRVSSACLYAVEMFTAWQMKKPKTGNTSGVVPEHSELSHIGEAFTYFCFNYKRTTTNSRGPRKQKKSFKTVSGVVI